MIIHKQVLSPIILTILDGWGHCENKQGNAIKLAYTPHMDRIWQSNPHTLLNASGKDVGLPEKQMGNSEVGHTTIGSGRIINQDLVRISQSINDKTFLKNEVLQNIYKNVKHNKSKLHLIGLCSNGGVHSHIKHLNALINLSIDHNIDTCIHIITDGRDTKPNSADTFINQINQMIAEEDRINICTISGRYYSMDRDCRWLRTEKAYNILINNDINEITNATEVIKKSYSLNIFDEFIHPIRINKGCVSDNDGIIFFNFRPDRIRQLLHCFANNSFKAFITKKINNLSIATFTQYDANLAVPIIFPPQEHKNFLGEILSQNGLKQLRLAETEKYAHVTYFFNGGIEEPFPGEDRELVPSPKVDTYDLDPKMSAYQLTESVIKAISKNEYSFIVINYANPDMVGHTGNLNATIEAISIIDECINRLFKKVNDVKGTLIITADHGNADYMIDSQGNPCTSHSTNPVPFILIHNNNEQTQNTSAIHLRQHGCLADIAPTILDLLSLKIPNDMNGKSLIEKNSPLFIDQYES